MIYNLFLYSGIFNVVLGSVYMFTKTTPTPEGIMMGGAVNLLMVLIYVGLSELKWRFEKKRGNEK